MRYSPSCNCCGGGGGGCCNGPIPDTLVVAITMSTTVTYDVSFPSCEGECSDLTGTYNVPRWHTYDDVALACRWKHFFSMQPSSVVPYTCNLTEFYLCIDAQWVSLTNRIVLEISWSLRNDEVGLDGLLHRIFACHVSPGSSICSEWTSPMSAVMDASGDCDINDVTSITVHV